MVQAHLGAQRKTALAVLRQWRDPTRGRILRHARFHTHRAVRVKRHVAATRLYGLVARRPDKGASYHLAAQHNKHPPINNLNTRTPTLFLLTPSYAFHSHYDPHKKGTANYDGVD